jgi:hypothetical protein
VPDARSSLLLIALAAPLASPATDDGASDDERCCFTNQRYSGVCVVEPVEDETRDSILAYLNDRMSPGKRYCQSTPIRGGGEEVECPPEESEGAWSAVVGSCGANGGSGPEQDAAQPAERAVAADTGLGSPPA